jgi:hypothetical protein
VNPVKVHPAKVRVYEACPAKVRLAGAFRTNEDRPAEARVAEVSPSEVHFVESRLIEACPAKVRFAEVCSVEVCHDEIRLAEVSPAEVHPVESRLAEARLAKVRLAEVRQDAGVLVTPCVPGGHALLK